MTTPRLYLPRPHENQRPILDSPARFKVIRAGRRFGKDRMAIHAATVGHGPREADGTPRWRGILQGVDVAWIGPDFPQIRAIWREEVEPRFGAVPGISIHQQERRVSVEGAGTLHFRSNENIDSLRGIRLGGAVLNEAAFFNLEYALKEVILPALMDLGGWVIIISTPNAGPDGYEDEVGKRSPSYFNLLCEEIAAGGRGPEWQHWHFTSYDNPKIPRAEIDALVAEYPPDSPALQQEIHAKLIAAGAGVAFPELDEAVHVARYEPPRHLGVWSGFGDWGYAKPGGLWLAWTGPERSLVRLEYYFRQTAPYTVGYQWGLKILPFPKPDYIVVDTPPVSDGGPTILEELQRGLNDAVGASKNPDIRPPIFVNPPKGPGSRETGKLLVHEALKYERAEDGTVPPWGLPKLQFHESCVNAIRTLSKLPRDPKGREDVDTAAEDHFFDALKGWLLYRTPVVERERIVRRDPDQHPGWTDDGRRRDRVPEVVETGPRWVRVPEGIA